MPARARYISNNHISVTVKNWNHVRMTFMPGNGISNNSHGLVLCLGEPGDGDQFYFSNVYSQRFFHLMTA